MKKPDFKRPKGADVELWQQSDQLIEAFIAAVDVGVCFQQLNKEMRPEDTTRFFIDVALNEANAHWSAAGRFQSIPEGWEEKPKVCFWGSPGDSALKVIIGFTKKIINGGKDMLPEAVDQFAVEGEAGGLLYEFYSELKHFLESTSLNTGTAAGQNDEDTPKTEPYVFRKENEHWRIVFDGKDLGVFGSLGFEYLHVLVGSPDKPFSAPSLELHASYEPTREREPSLENRIQSSDISGQSWGEIKKQDIESQISFLDILKTECEKENDPAVKIELDERIQDLEEHIKDQQNIRGGPKAEGDTKNTINRVAKAIKTAKEKLEFHKPAHRHFTKAITREDNCWTYAPETPPNWLLQ